MEQAKMLTTEEQINKGFVWWKSDTCQTEPREYKMDDYELFDTDLDPITVADMVYKIVKTYPGMNQEGIIVHLQQAVIVDRQQIIDGIAELGKTGKIKYDKSIHGWRPIIEDDDV